MKFVPFDPLTTTLITPNRRLSAALLKKYDREQLALKKTYWPSLDILPFNNWIERCWQTGALKNLDHRYHILSAQQEAILWEEILRASSATERLLQLSATAETAQSAWGLLKQWQVPLDHPGLSLTDDGRCFLDWAQSFQETCQHNQWLSPVCLIEQLADALTKRQVTLAPITALLVIGFTELTPLQKKIFSACESTGTTVNYIENMTANMTATPSAARIKLENTETEIEMMARWAKALSDQLSAEQRPFSIACIVPHLEKMRDRIEQVFLQVFKVPGLATLAPAELPFNISAGKPLAAYPPIYAALQWLTLPTQLITSANLSYLLRSTFIGEAEFERNLRAQLDLRLRTAAFTEIALAEFVDLPLLLSSGCAQLRKRLHRFLTYFTELPATLNVAEWALHFHELLSIFGWPGERSLSSHEYQITQRWLELLKEQQKCHIVLPSLNYAQALHYLTYAANTTIYQPQTPEAPIQILGTLEAAGLSFDYLWAMGLDDTAWPPPAKPNPFIPTALQKKLHMPHASAERELLYSQRLTQQLQQNATHAIFSHAEHNVECALQPSALIASLPEVTCAELQLSDFVKPAELIFHSQLIETFSDEQGPPLQLNEEINGGAAILKYQAACPFKAFATIRLKARPLATPTLGLSYQERGIIIHKALENFWQQMNTSLALTATSADTCNKIVADSIDRAMQTTVGKRPRQARYLQLEVARLQQLIMQWLAIEKTRPFFKVVAQEENYAAQIGPLSLNLRIDRIDELADGTQLIIDYKTGKNNFVKYWFSERPDEPQLPLYCASLLSPITGIAFAEIHTESLGFKGACKEDLAINGIKALHEIHFVENKSWDEQIHSWKGALATLATDFYHGNSQVDPKDRDLTCKQCDLHSLCRIR